jgi:hypothetical protein
MFSNIENIDNIHSDKHVIISGTNISMIPPPEFEPSKNFKGFNDPNDKMSIIMIVEIPGPFDEISKGFQPDLMKEREMNLISSKRILINGIDGLLLEFNQKVNGLTFSKYALLYGNRNHTTLINGMFLEDSITTGKLIKECINSTVVNLDMNVDPRLAMDYTIDETAGDFTFESVMGNAMMFNKLHPTDTNQNITIMVDKSYQKTQVADKKTFCIKRLGQLPETYNFIETKGLNEIVVDGISGYELYASSANNPLEELYQAILFDDDGGYFIFIAIYKSDQTTEIENIRNVVKSFKRK